MMRHARVAAILSAAMLGAGLQAVARAQALETESARFPHAGTYELATAFEFQTSAEGSERAVPLGLEYAPVGRLAFLVEPVAYTAIRPRSGRSANGAGDLEMTAFYLVAGERNARPALAVAAEVKLPTTKNPLIGTGRTDYTAYLIASKRFAALDLHANAGYTIVGQPPGTRLNNIFNGAVAAEYRLGRKAMVFGEVLGNTSSAPEGGGDNATNTNAVVPEAAGGELSGTAGAGVYAIRNLLMSLGLSYDNRSAWLIRPGLAWRLR